MFLRRFFLRGAAAAAVAGAGAGAGAGFFCRGLSAPISGWAGADLDFFFFSSLEARCLEIHARQRRIELNEDHMLSALKHHASYVLAAIYLTKLENKEIEFKARYPYQGDALLDEILKKMGRDQDKDSITEIINRSINVEMGKVFIDRAQRDINNLLMGRKSVDDKSREATRVMIQSVLEKAAEKDKEEDEGPEDDDDSGVILL